MVVVGAAVAISVGYLGNGVFLDAQQLGVGETNLESPVRSVAVTALIERMVNPDIPLDFKDLIVVCTFISNDEVEKDSTIICKLLDTSGNVIAEGKKIVDPALPALTPFTVPINEFEFLNAHNINNVHDIIIVVQGP